MEEILESLAFHLESAQTQEKASREMITEKRRESTWKEWMRCHVPSGTNKRTELKSHLDETDQR